MGGEIIFNGKDILKASEAEMRHIRGNHIAMIFQEPTTSLNPVLNIKQQLAEALELHRGIDKKAAAEEALKLLQLVGIPNPDRRLQDYPHQFSGGMQQRIMIAMALSCSPDLLIADEPTTSVDVTVQAQLLEVLHDMRNQFGMAVIIITHNLGIVARYADEVNVMYAGRMVEGGSTDTIYHKTRHPYTMGLIASVPRLDLPRKRSISTIEGLPPNLARLPKNICAFSPRCKFAISKCREQRPELEEVEPGHTVACFRQHEVRQLAEAA
jgi:oligopeptide/dipeptide ABC transporter ATP-binding protein